eukprot:352053-Amphidinium_carterae.1
MDCLRDLASCSWSLNGIAGIVTCGTVRSMIRMIRRLVHAIRSWDIRGCMQAGAWEVGDSAMLHTHTVRTEMITLQF